MAEKFIQKAIQHPGALHRQLGVPDDQPIPEDVLRAAAKKSGKLGNRARLALLLKGFNKPAAKAKPKPATGKKDADGDTD